MRACVSEAWVHGRLTQSLDWLCVAGMHACVVPFVVV